VTATEALRRHWPEYLIEAWALGMFMISAGLFAVAFEYPGSQLRQWIGNADLRRALIGVAMGLTAIAIIYSRPGKRSGAHMNPAITLSFLRLGKIAPIDAFFYIAAQFAGGLFGVLLVSAVFGAAFRQAPVAYVATLPGEAGIGIAFAAEVLISAGMMLMVLLVSNSARFATATGVCAGLLVATYITIEGPLSGMSMNPARSFASAAPGGMWHAFWIYCTAPLLGMLASTEIYLRLHGRKHVHCAKLLHPDDVRCIHCNYEPEREANPPLAGIKTRTGA
jgi:aquaporin Z